MPFFDDFAPELLSAPTNYAGAMQGRGRWAELFTDADRPVGVLWTNDSDGLGLYPVDGADDESASETLRTITANAAAKYPARDLFDYLVNEFRCDVYSGSLDDLFDSLDALDLSAEAAPAQ